MQRLKNRLQSYAPRHRRKQPSRRLKVRHRLYLLYSRLTQMVSEPSMRLSQQMR